MHTRSTNVIALFDILGTKNRMTTHGIDGVLTTYERLATFVDQQSGSMVIRPVPVGDGTFCPAVGWLEVEKAYFSDTFLLWADHEAFRLPAFMQMCIDLFCYGLELGIPLRGALGVGDAHMDRTKNICLGPALIDAAEAEKTQCWLGISCGTSFNQEPFTGPFDPRLILAYAEQQKPGTEYTLPGLVLDWPRRWRETRKTDARATLDSMDTEPKYAPLYRCANEFVAFSLQSHDWFLKGIDMRVPGEQRGAANGSQAIRSKE
jgi:hypothetical protein